MMQTVGNEDPETVSQDSFRAEHRGAVEHAEHAVLRATKHAIHSLKVYILGQYTYRYCCMFCVCDYVV